MNYLEALLMAKVAYPSKNSSLVEIEITANRDEAIRFNKKQRRFGAGVTMCLVAPREERAGAEASKRGTGAGKGDDYTTPLGEKRTVY